MDLALQADPTLSRFLVEWKQVAQFLRSSTAIQATKDILDKAELHI